MSAQLGQGSVTLVFEEQEYRRCGDESGIGSGFEAPNMVGHFLPGGPGNQENIAIGEETVFLQEEACLDFGGGSRHGGGDPLPPEMLKTLNPRAHDQIVDGVLENLEKDP
jgi:hypothetical protein